MRRAFTFIELLVCIAIIVILLALLGIGIFDLFLHVLLGWVFFIIRNSQEMTVDVGAVASAAVSLCLLGVGVHSFGKWLARHRQAKLPPDSPTKIAWSAGASAAVVGLIVLMFCAGVSAIGITHQSYWLATSPEPWFERSSLRDLAAKTQSSNNLRHIGIAAHSHQDLKKQLPQGVVLTSNGQPVHGWPTLLLPYLEQEPLFKRIDLSLPWNHPRNADLANERVQVYLNPLLDKDDDEAGRPLNHYAGNVRVLGVGKSMRVDDIIDGASNTILFGEAGAGLRPWASPWHVRDPAKGFGVSPETFGIGAHPKIKGATFIMGDASVKFISGDVSPAVWRALATPAGKEKLPQDWDQ